jgi:hypothetical protein
VSKPGLYISFVLAGLASRILIDGLGFLLLVFLLRVLLRRDWLAVLVAASVLTLFNPNFIQHPLSAGPIVILSNLLIFFVLVRFGFTTFVAGLTLLSLFGFVQMALQPSAWYFSYGITSLLLIAALSFYGFRMSLGGQPVFDIAAVDR